MWLSPSSATRKQNASPWRAFPHSLSGGSLDRDAMHYGTPRSSVVAGNRQTRSLSEEDGAAVSLGRRRLFAYLRYIELWWFRRRLFDGRQNQLSAGLFQNALHREVHQQREAVGDLLRLGCPESRPFGIQAATIPRDVRDFGMLLQPGRETLSGSIRQEVYHLVQVQIHPIVTIELNNQIEEAKRLLLRSARANIKGETGR